jgi:protein-tyrosine-phosphatase
MQPKRILFVCIENSFRSQIAEAFACIYGGNEVTAYSAGSKPSGQVHPQAVAIMREIGYDLARHTSKSLSEIPDIEYDVAITMGCGDECPMVRAKRRESWDIPDPKNLHLEEVTAIRDLIGTKVKELLVGLSE